MKIAIVNQVKITGGKGVHAFELAKSLRHLGHHVDIIPRYSGRLSLLRYFLSFSKKYDIIHLHELDPEAVIACYLASHMFEFGSILTIHQFGVSSIPKNILIGKVTIYCLRHLDVVICVSNYIASEYTRIIGNNGAKTVIIHNGVDANFFNPDLDPKYIITKRGFKATRIILFVGRLIKSKGINYLLESFAKLDPKTDNIMLILCGEGPMRSSIESKIREMKLQDQVIIEGYVLGHLLPYYYAAADIYVFPSLSEPFGLVILEAMSMRKPVISSNVGGIPEIIEDGRNGLLVPAGNVEVLTASIKKLLVDRDLSQRLGYEGRKTIINKFTKEKMVRKTIEAYQIALTERTKGKQARSINSIL